MKPVYITDFEIVSPLGSGIDQNWASLHSNQHGIHMHSIHNNELFLGMMPEHKLEGLTKLESSLIYCIDRVVQSSKVNCSDEKLLLIISTTKGNIGSIASPNATEHVNAYLWQIAKIVQQKFLLVNTPLVLSNACVSGVMASEIGKKYINEGWYNKVLVCGVDCISAFITEGFLSLKAMSRSICKPLDSSRDGINLGEAAACILLEDSSNNEEDIAILSAASSNDANHISGPSRTGDGLALAINKVWNDLPTKHRYADFISLHGTATLFNDEMEYYAIESLHLTMIPTNSFKSYTGHTLGAAGVIEIIFSILCMKHNLLIRSLQYESSNHVWNIITENTPRELNQTLKLSSGFGGCNSVLLLSKIKELV